MRGRTKLNHTTLLIPGTYITDTYGNTVNLSNPYSRDTISSASSMSDYDNGDHVTPNECIHSSVTAVGGVTMLSQQWDPSYTYHFPVYPTVSGAPTVEPTVTTTLSQSKALEEILKGNLSDSVLAPVTFKELPQMRTIHKQLIGKGFGAKSFANRFLAYKFGILPFVKDLTDLWALQSKIARHLKFVEENYNTRVKVKMSTGTVKYECGYYKPTSDVAGTYETARGSGSSVAHANLTIVRRYTTGDIIRTYLDAYSGGLLNVIWEAVPYSFVVDWFVDVGGVINALQPRFQVPCAVVNSFCNCVKASCNVPLYEWDGPNATGRAVRFGDLSYKFFHRTVEPVSASTVLGSGLSWSKGLVGGALAIQKVL